MEAGPAAQRRLPGLGPRWRLAVLLVVLAAAYAVFWIGDVIDSERIREWVDSVGPLAPLAYVPIAAALGMLLVPGPILAGASGLLFGPFLGSLVTLLSAVLSAVGSLLVASRTGRAGVDELTPERYAAIADVLRRHGTVAVIVQRLAPGIPDAPLSYAAGLVGIAAWQIALGTLIGAAPRAFSYTALGSTLDDPTSPIGLAAIAGIVLTGLVGAAIAGRILLRWRRSENRAAPLD